MTIIHYFIHYVNISDTNICKCSNLR